MNIQPGSILISAPSLEDSNFKKAVIFITEYNKKGASGFVINKIFPRRFNELTEFKNSLSFPLYNGGPVEQESLFVLHRCPGIIDDSTAITDSIYMGGNFKQAVAGINNNSITKDDIKLFIGYCGWDDEELDAEIAEGSWLIADAAAGIIFYEDIEILWEMLYKKIV